VIIRLNAGLEKTMKQSTIKSILSKEYWLLFQIFTAGGRVYFQGNDLHYYAEDFKKFCKVHKLNGGKENVR
jgi:hypothetical protein